MGQFPFACGFQPGITHLAAKPDDSLRTAQVDEHLTFKSARIRAWQAGPILLACARHH